MRSKKIFLSIAQEEYKAIVGGDEPLRRKDANKKDENLLKKLNILTGAMNQIPEDKRKVRTKVRRSSFVQLTYNFRT
mgnify:CR=1 FL=1